MENTYKTSGLPKTNTSGYGVVTAGGHLLKIRIHRGEEEENQVVFDFPSCIEPFILQSSRAFIAFLEETAKRYLEFDLIEIDCELVGSPHPVDYAEAAVNRLEKLYLLVKTINVDGKVDLYTEFVRSRYIRPIAEYGVTFASLKFAEEEPYAQVLELVQEVFEDCPISSFLEGVEGPGVGMEFYDELWKPIVSILQTQDGGFESVIVVEE